MADRVEKPIKIVQIGAGSMGRRWLQTIKDNPDVRLTGLVDLDLDAARAAADQSGHVGVAVARSLSELSELSVAADAVVDVTVPEAHRPTCQEALALGLPVLCEKPIAPTVAEALEMVASAKAAGRLLMISQSRRYFDGFRQFRELVGALGTLGVVSCEFFKAPHFGGFRDVMDQPLLVDMAIHTFDAARALIGSDPVSVYCETFNPAWSWYAGDAAATAVFEFPDGVRFSYTGSWCSDGQQTSWNGRWRASAENGTAIWDGDNAPTVECVDGDLTVPAAPGLPEQIAGSLAEFVDCLLTGAQPATTAAANVASLAMVEAAVHSATERRRVLISEVLSGTAGPAAAAAAV